MFKFEKIWEELKKEEKGESIIIDGFRRILKYLLVFMKVSKV